MFRLLHCGARHLVSCSSVDNPLRAFPTRQGRHRALATLIVSSYGQYESYTFQGKKNDTSHCVNLLTRGFDGPFHLDHDLLAKIGDTSIRDLLAESEECRSVRIDDPFSI